MNNSNTHSSIKLLNEIIEDLQIIFEKKKRKKKSKDRVHPSQYSAPQGSKRDKDLDAATAAYAAGDIEINADGDQIDLKFGGASGQLQFGNANSGDVTISSRETNKDLVIMLETFERSPEPIAGIKFPAK